MDSGIATLILSVQQFQIARYLDVTIFTIFIVDYFQTLTTEIDLLWPAPWTPVKILYFISRYTPFINGPITLVIISSTPASAAACIRVLNLEIWTGSVGETCSHLLLAYRVHALMGRTRLSTVLLSSLALALVIVSIPLIFVVQRGIESTGANIPSIFPKCSVNSAESILMATPVGAVIYETILFGMVYWAKKKKYKEDESLLIKKLYRDAFLYYLLLIVISAGSLIWWFATGGPIRAIPSSLPTYFMSMIASRIILNIRQYASIQRNPVGTAPVSVGDATAQSVTVAHFASRGQVVTAADAELRLY